MDFDSPRNSSFEMRGEFIPGEKSGQMIQFKLDLEVEISNWIINQHGLGIPQFDERDPPSIHTHTTLATNMVSESLMRDDILKAVQYAIDDCEYRLDREERHELISRAWAEVWKIFEADRTRPYTNGVLNLHCMARVERRQVYEVVNVVETDVDETDYPRMIPAADSSLSLLEKYEVDRAADCCCCICLEELKGGRDGALKMPCSHVFHCSCIKNWLRSSHFCPLWPVQILDFHCNNIVIM